MEQENKPYGTIVVVVLTVVTAWGIYELVKAGRKRKLSGFESLDSIAKDVLSKPTGEERIVNDSLHYGVSKPYAYREDIKAAGVKFTPSKNPLFGYVKRSDVKKLLSYLKEKDGYLSA